MVGHQDVGVNTAISLAGGISQTIKVEAVIVVAKETGLAVIATLDQVQRNAGKRQTGTAWHVKHR